MCTRNPKRLAQAPKRKSVPEAAAAEVTAPPEKRAAGASGAPAGRKAGAPAAGGAGVPSLRELQADRLTAVADANWRLPEGKPRPAFDGKVVEKVYADELGGGERAPMAQRASVLEISQYLELYLWPHFDSEAASTTHVLSILLMVNEKFRETVAGWACFTDADKFARFFKRCVVRARLRGLPLLTPACCLLAACCRSRASVS